jgi:hypothetical protein
MEQRDRGGRRRYLEKIKTGGGIGDMGSWGVESTQELENPTEESRNR